ncbi:MAG: dihydroneopterin aldolase family protein [Thermoplasmata archaeon]|nr:dihydroneopterin aldolase family protein [Thermoplasmata archaeon]
MRAAARGREPRSLHGAVLSDREALLFEVGIKLGGVFHQYLGTPVSRRTAAGLARTIEQALRLQPYVAAVRVRIVPSRAGPTGAGAFAYHYLTAEMLHARVTLVQGRTRVTAELAHRSDLRYPLMRVVAVHPARTDKQPAR